MKQRPIEEKEQIPRFVKMISVAIHDEKLYLCI